MTVAAPRGRTTATAITASAARTSALTTQVNNQRIPQWQLDSFAYYDTIGAVRYAAQFWARGLSKIRFFAAERDDKGEVKETSDPDAIEAFERVQDPMGGRVGLTTAYGHLRFLTGEAYLVWTPATDGDPEVWEVVSMLELRKLSKRGGRETWHRIEAPGLNPQELVEAADSAFEPLGNEVIVYRLWQRHPAYCADDQTEILTLCGWRKHDELSVGDTVLTLNHETGQSEWQPVSAVNRFQVENEPMVSIERTSHSSLTTREHRWPTMHYHRPKRRGNYVTREWATSETLNSNDNLLTAAECADLPTERTWSDDFVEAVAWFYTEGGIAKRYVSAQVTISQSGRVNPQYVERIRGALTGHFGEATTERMSTGSGTLAPPKWREHRRKTGKVEFWLNTAASAELLEVAPDKVVGLAFIRNLTREQLDIFIETSLAADGYGTLLSQKDERRLAAFELACILSGRTPRTSRTTSGRCAMSHVRAYALRTFGVAARRGGRMKDEVSYTGTVWCPTTKNGTWLARRRGTVYYTGNSKMADSPMRSVLADCEEIVRCTHTINARLISRLSGPGIFVIPMSWKVKPLEQVAGESNPAEDPFQVRLTQTFLAAIATPGSAESVAPIVVQVPDDTTEKAHLYKIWEPNEVIRELETRDKAQHRFAVGVDMPPAKVEGIEGTTHWNAWAIDKEGLEHLTPVAQAFCNDIASAYLRPTLRNTYGREDWDRFVVGFDSAGAVTNPDAFSDAVVMYDKRVVGKAYLRSAGNATNGDAMTDEELTEALFVATNQVVEVAAGALVSDTPSTAEDTEQDMPEEPEKEDVVELPVAASSNGTGELTTSELMVMAQAELVLEEIRAHVGRKVIRHLSGGKCSECVETVKSVPAQLVVAELGETVIRENDVDLRAFADNTGAQFGAVLERKGVRPHDARALQEVLEVHAVASIYEQVPGLPAGFTGRVRVLAAAA